MFKTELSSGVLSNGAQYAFAHVANAKFASCKIDFKVGYRDENLDQNGVAHFLEHAVMSHAPIYDGQEFTNYYKNMQVNVNGSTGVEWTQYYCNGLKARAMTCLEDVQKIVTPQEFKPALIERERGRIIEEINESEIDVRRMAAVFHVRNIFSAETVGREALGPKSIVEKLSLNDIYNFYTQNYSAEKVIFTMAGSVDHDRMLKNLEKFTDSLPKNRLNNTRLPIDPVNAYNTYQHDGFDQVITTVSFVDKFANFEDRLLTRNTYAALSNYIDDQIMKTGSHYGMYDSNYLYDGYSLKKFYFIGKPQNVQIDTLNFIGHIKNFGKSDLSIPIKRIRNAQEHDNAVNSETYGGRSEELSGDLCFYKEIISDERREQASQILSENTILSRYQDVLKQIPSVTFYGNVKAANLPDNNQWIRDKMKL